MLSTMTFGLLFLFFLLISISLSLADLAGEWPEIDEPPPVKEEFTKLVDLSKVANAPLNIGPDNGPPYVDCNTDNSCYWNCGCTRQSDVENCPSIRDWGLTFDDGPSEYTSELIDYLDSQGLTITFFVIGSRVKENPEVLLKAVKSGHQIGIHTWSHPYLTTQSNEQVIAELQWTADIIKNVTGVVPKYMRPPYGDFDDRIRNICSQLGYIVTVWDRDTDDWMIGEPGSNFNVKWVTGNFTKWAPEKSTTGHISLEHDIYKDTAAQGPKVVPILKKAKFNIKPVAKCLGDNNPYLNSIISIPTTTSKSPQTSASISSTTSHSAAVSPVDEISPSHSSSLTTPTPVSSSEIINYNNWLIILGLLMSLTVYIN